MNKTYHKIGFWVVFGGFIFAVAVFYFLAVDKTYGVTYPSDIKVEGDTLFGQEVTTSGGQTFSSGDISWDELSPDIALKTAALVKKYGGEEPVPATAVQNILQDINPGKIPEGRVLWVEGDVRIDQNIQMKGKGTIVIYGNLTINANLSYAGANDSVGFIVLDPGGTITIEKNVTNLRGVFYASKEIKFRYNE